MYGFFITIIVSLHCVNSQLSYFDADCLQAHNKYRAAHGSPPLVWSQSLAAAAQSYVNTIATGYLLESDVGLLEQLNQGENIGYTLQNETKCESSGQVNCIKCSDFVDHWYSKIQDYDFEAGHSRGGPVAVFTQIVWSSTRELGVGTSLSRHYGLVAVARYSPPGNFGDFESYKNHVPPPYMG